MSDDHYQTNERWWSERASFHLQTPMYREFVEQLRQGGDALLPFDDAVLGSVQGKSILHLQCHVGTDTLSLARRGATVTGVDFSETALQQARALGKDLGIDAQFVHGNAIDLPDSLSGPYDIVYTSYGVLCWLSDLGAWARGIAARLRPGGRLVVIDGHPLRRSIAEDNGVVGERVTLAYPYLSGPPPERFEEGGSYANAAAKTEHNAVYEWSHGVGDVVTAILDAGLTLDVLREHPESFYCAFKGMVQGADRLWRFEGPLRERYPLTLTVVAHA